MSRPSKLPQWATAPDGVVAAVVEPSSGKKAQGWEQSESPASSWMNWLLNVIYSWLVYFDVSIFAARYATWLDRSTSFVSAAGRAVCYGTYSTGIYIAVGTNACAMSSDGMSWTSKTIPAGVYNAVCWGNSLFVAVGTSSACATSPDGTTWTGRTISAGSYYAVTWVPTLNLFVAVGVNVCATSPDGTTWTPRTIPAGSYVDLAWSGSTLVAVGTNVCATSANATTWAAQTIAASSYTNVVWTGSIFVAVSNIAIVTSVAGTSWAAGTMPVGAASLAVFTGVLIAIGSRFSTTALGYSSDGGTTWTADHNILMAASVTPGNHGLALSQYGGLVVVGGVSDAKCYVAGPVA